MKANGEDEAASAGGGEAGGDVEQWVGNIGRIDSNTRAVVIGRMRPYGSGKQKSHGLACLNGVIGPLSAKHHDQIAAQLFFRQYFVLGKSELLQSCDTKQS